MSADDKSCPNRPDFSHELYHRYISILVTFMYRGNHPMLSQLPWVLTLVFKNASSHLGVEMLNSQVGKSFIRGEFNNASARRALVDWYLSLFIMCKA